MRAACIAVAIVSCLLLPASASGQVERAPKKAIGAALERAVLSFADPAKLAYESSLRSSENRRWSLVTGRYGRRGLWAAWVRRDGDGEHVVRVFRKRNFDPGARVPCDLRPAFSEPSC